MGEYLDCSLPDTTSTTFGPLGVLFSSDERNAGYRRAIQDMVQARGHVGIDVDGLILDEIQRLVRPELINNYLVFSVVKAVCEGGNTRRRRPIAFRMIRRRRHCSTCPNVMEQIQESR